MTEQLSPEQEALVDDAGRMMADADGESYDAWFELYDRRARAIIPLIYTAGRWAGREEAAKVCEDAAIVNGHLYEDGDREVPAYDWAASELIHTAKSIRSFSEEASRG